MQYKINNYMYKQSLIKLQTNTKNRKPAKSVSFEPNNKDVFNLELSNVEPFEKIAQNENGWTTETINNMCVL